MTPIRKDKQQLRRRNRRQYSDESASYHAINVLYWLRSALMLVIGLALFSDWPTSAASHAKEPSEIELLRGDVSNLRTNVFNLGKANYETAQVLSGVRSNIADIFRRLGVIESNSIPLLTAKITNLAFVDRRLTNVVDLLIPLVATGKPLTNLANFPQWFLALTNNFTNLPNQFLAASSLPTLSNGIIDGVTIYFDEKLANSKDELAKSLRQGAIQQTSYATSKFDNVSVILGPVIGLICLICIGILFWKLSSLQAKLCAAFSLEMQGKDEAQKALCKSFEQHETAIKELADKVGDIDAAWTEARLGTGQRGDTAIFLAKLHTLEAEIIRLRENGAGAQVVARIVRKPETEGRGKPPVKRSLSPSEILGVCFASFCRAQETEFAHSAFVEKLRLKLPDAQVTWCYRPSGATELDLYFTNVKESSPQRYWRVTIGRDNYLLPFAVRKDRFEGLDGYEIDPSEHVTPGTLEYCKPIFLKGSDQRWEVEKRGRLSLTERHDMPAWEDVVTPDIDNDKSGGIIDRPSTTPAVTIPKSDQPDEGVSDSKSRNENEAETANYSLASIAAKVGDGLVKYCKQLKHGEHTSCRELARAIEGAGIRGMVTTKIFDRAPIGNRLQESENEQGRCYWLFTTTHGDKELHFLLPFLKTPSNFSVDQNSQTLNLAFDVEASKAFSPRELKTARACPVIKSKDFRRAYEISGQRGLLKF